MFCPACLAYGAETVAETTVNGTQFCRAHGVHALQLPSNVPGGGRGRPGRFAPPAASIAQSLPPIPPVDTPPPPDPEPAPEA